MPAGNRENLTNEGKGRKKGSKNKFTNLKDSFLNVYQELGGGDALLKWAKINKTQFYGMIKSLLPKQIEADITHGIDDSLMSIIVELYKKEEAKKVGSNPRKTK